MSLTVAVAVLAIVALMIPVFARTRPADLDFSIFVVLAVMLTVRSAQPAQFYVQLVAVLLAAIMSVVAFREVPREVYKALRVEWVLLGGVVIAMVFGEILPPGSQGAAVVAAGLLGATLIFRALLRGTALLIRAHRNR